MDDRDGASLYEIEIGIVVPAVIYAPVLRARIRSLSRISFLVATIAPRGRAFDID
jgi:hypothetical protein